MTPSVRIRFISIVFFLLTLAVISRLFYWQVIKGEELAGLASNQRRYMAEIVPNRGTILSNDGFPLAINQEGFLVYANPQKLDQSPKTLAQLLTPILVPGLDTIPIATDASEQEIEQIQDDLLDQTERYLYSQLSQDELVWVLLTRKLNSEKKTELESLDLSGLAFTAEPIRAYPEASMSAHLLGFVGQNEYGADTGYFGLEGFYDLELSGRMGVKKQEKDAVNRPIPIGKFWDQTKRDGRHLQLYLDRSIQFIVEETLQKAVKKYGAKSGSVVIMDPQTGGILAMASWPSFNPALYTKHASEAFINPIISKTYEPGSTFKVLTMATALDKGVVKPHTICDICDQPYKIDKYLIRTWNDRYHKDTTMTEALAHSDNIAMVFVAQQLGVETFVNYLQKFGIGQMTGIDVQGEAVTPLREQWGEVDLLTASFGQGLAVTAIQMLAAVGAVANDGMLLQPHMVHKILDSQRELELKPKIVNQVIRPETAEVLTEMLVAAVDYGDAKWAVPKGYKIAGKTGTSQVAIAGHYDEEKTIASFVGFAPADDPAFVMLTIIDEPTSSPWGSETAAPLFFDIAQKLFVHLGISKSE